MSDSDGDDDSHVVFGTALEPMEEEELSRKKPLTVSDQVAVDERGRRRFHGAFTGGFSAGYFNTVGSKEGWAPANFKSTRSDRTSFKTQNVHDFMDEEDTGVFGIAPQILRPTEDFTFEKRETRKRSKPVVSDGPIPGVPVLEQIIQPVRETIGMKVLQRMGWRPGQGIGPRIRRSAKKKKEKAKKKSEEEVKEKNSDVDVDPDVDKEGDSVQPSTQKVYGCILPPTLVRPGDSDSDSCEEIDPNILFAPDDIPSPVCIPKENTFGLGYKGLDRDALSTGHSHINLFGGAELKLRVDNKKMNIMGEAFGVGAFEEADSDIYSREDLSEYDFALETPEERKTRRTKEMQDKANNKKRLDGSLDGFLAAVLSVVGPKHFAPPHLPKNFQPIHITRKSRFEQVVKNEEDQTNKKGLGRHSLTIAERQVLLGESRSTTNEPQSDSSTARKDDDTAGPSSSSSNQNPISNQRPNEAKKGGSSTAVNPSIQERVERLKKFTQVLQAYSSSKPTETSNAFKPFMKNPEKQDRYDKYLTLVAAGFQECLKDLQPQEMTEWEHEREKQEFERAAALYKPISGVMSSRFVSAKSHDISHVVPEREVLKEKDPTQDPKVAAKMNLFGKLTHKVVEWHPDRILCKRFNVPPPYPESKFVGVRNSSHTEPSSGNIPTPLPVVKKSLFDNLDFSKPPPGLAPATSLLPSSLSATLEFSGDASTTDSAEPPPPGTDIKIELPVSENESVAPEATVISKPPMDLFKEIFADTSDSEDEDDDNHTAATAAPPAASLPPKVSNTTIPSSLKGKSEMTEHKDKIREEEMKSDDFDIPSGRESHHNSTTKTTTTTDSQSDSRSRQSFSLSDGNKRGTSNAQNRGIFDKLDFSKLDPSSEIAADGNKGFSGLHSTSKIKIEVEDKSNDIADEDLYGPRLPTKASAPKPLIPQSPSSSKTLTLPLNYNYSTTKKLQSSSQVKTSKAIDEEEDVVWVEKESSHSSSRSRKKHKKKTSKSSSHHKSRSKSSRSSTTTASSKTKRAKDKSKDKSHKLKHKAKKQKHKSKSSKVKKSRSRRRDSSSSDDNSISSDSDNNSGSQSDSSSSSSITIHDSLDNKALLAQLKQITRSN